MKTGTRPMRTTLRLFLDWGIEFGRPYEIEERSHRQVAYADKQELEEEIIRRHHGDVSYGEYADRESGAQGGGMSQAGADQAYSKNPQPGSHWRERR